MTFKKIVCTIVLINLTAIHSKGQSTQRSITDSLRLLLPKGYFVLTEQGAKEALKAKIDASIYQRQLALKDSILALKDTIITYQKAEITEWGKVDLLQQKALKKAQTKVVLKTIEVWAYRVALTLKIVGIW